MRKRTFLFILCVFNLLISNNLTNINVLFAQNNRTEIRIQNVSGDSLAILEQKYNKAHNWYKLTSLYYLIAQKYYKSKNYNLAVSYYLKVDSISKRYGILTDTIVKAIRDRSEISKLQFTPDAMDLAEELSREAIQKAGQLQNPDLIFDAKLLLSEIVLLKRRHDEALKLLKESENYFRKKDDALHMARVFLLYKIYYEHVLKDYKKTDSVLNVGIRYLQSKELPEKLSDLHIFYANFLKDKMLDNKKALRHYNIADSLFYAHDSVPKLHYIYLLEGLSDVYEKSGQYKKALYYNKKAYSLRQELYKKQNKELSRRLETRYQAKVQRERLNYELQQNRLLRQQKYFFVIVIVLLILLFSLMYYQYRNRQKIIDKLKELDKAKSDFFANISHEFRTPLTLILAPVKQRLNKSDLQKEEKNLLQIIRVNAERLLDLINQVLDLSKLESGKRKLKVTGVNPGEFLSFTAHNFESLADQKNITFTIDNRCNVKNIWIDRDVVQKITDNLLSNSFKYTNQGGQVVFKSYCNKDYLHIIIKNTGKSLTNEELHKIFERFYQKDIHSEGIGLGLSIVKQLVEFHKGHIKVRSGKDGWTVFKVVIPITKKTYKPEEIVTDYPKQEKTSINAIEQKQEIIVSENCPIQKSDNPLLLVIEDNDAVRQYISSVFDDCFKVITAKDGNEGIAKAFEFIPDIIISDVMMPDLDGFEVTKRLKSDEKTNHIPVILLTAKAGEENKIEGLTAGADDYIEKPFNEQILRLKVDNLLATRQKIKEKILQNTFTSKIPDNIPGKDVKFFEHLKQVIEKHLKDPEFTADRFAQQMGMSRMQLHRKLKALTGKSTSQFIRIQRLNYAARLLRETEANVSEVAYQAGFNDPGYFNKCFKKQFGKTPLEFKQ